MPKVSFIIPSYNSFKTIFRTLDSILDLRSQEEIHEVIVIDSSDDVLTRRMIQKYKSSRVSIIELDGKTPPAQGRNMGAQMATGELLCFIDSDVYLDPGWLEHVLMACHSGCRMGGGAVGVSYFQDRNPVVLAQLYLQFNESLQVGQRRPIAMLPACNMFVQKDLFDEAKGFPSLRASEDVVFCLKCASLATIWFVPQALCFHIFREEQESFFQNQTMLGQYIMVYRRGIYKKWYYQKPWACLLLPMFLLIKTLRIMGRIIKAGHLHLTGFIFSSPFFLAGLFYWARGFYRESIIETPQSTGAW